jgi:hypothetical protein
MRVLTPPEGRQVFELPFAPEPAHIGANGHVNNVVYLAWAQDLAIAHWSATASNADQSRWGWVVLRHEVDYRRPLQLGETARGLTWVDDAPRAPASPASAASTDRRACAPRSAPLAPGGPQERPPAPRSAAHGGDVRLERVAQKWTPVLRGNALRPFDSRARFNDQAIPPDRIVL